MLGQPSPHVNAETVPKTSVGHFRTVLLEIDACLVLEKIKNQRVLILLWHQILRPSQSSPHRRGAGGAINLRLWLRKLEIMGLLCGQFQISST